jgi:hypothetical protein
MKKYQTPITNFPLRKITAKPLVEVGGNTVQTGFTLQFTLAGAYRFLA